MTNSSFKFDPNFDYYPMFEASMAAGQTAELNDPADFDEFVLALKAGRYDPETGVQPEKN